MTGVLKRIFRKDAEGSSTLSKQNPVPASKESPTIPIPNPNQGGEVFPAIESDAKERILQYELGCAQSVGRVRDHNEDSFFTFSSNLAHHGAQFSTGIYMIADGMGGHRNGELASSLAVKTMGQHLISQLFQPENKLPTTANEISIEELMRESINNAHQVIRSQASGSGTTLTAALITGNQITIAHIGDSRCYFISSEGKLNRVTRDHSLVMRMIELGQITKEEAAVHPQRNILYRALGQDEPISPDIQSYPVFPGGYILICSDGLWGVVPETKITETILGSANPQEKCEQLVYAANEAGGPDNITAILVRLPEQQE